RPQRRAGSVLLWHQRPRAPSTIADRRRTRCRQPEGSGPFNRTAHDGVLQALGADVLEARLLVHRAGPVVDERVVHPLLADLVRVPFDDAAAERGDLLQRTGESHLGVALAAEALVDEDAGDAEVGYEVGFGEVLLAVLDVRQLIRGAVVGPRDRLVADDHQRHVSLSGLDQLLLERAASFVARPSSGAVVEVGAPATAEDAVVTLYQPGERLPRFCGQRLNRVATFHVAGNLAPQ